MRYRNLAFVVMLLGVLAAPPTLAKSIGQNLLINPGAEQGNISGWKANPSFTIRSHNPVPYEGNFYFFAWCRAHQELRQTVDLTSYFTVAELDSGHSQVRVGGYQRSWAQNPSDEGQIVVHFLNGLDEVIDTFEGPVINDTSSWILTEEIRMLPIGTRQIEFIFLSTRRAGSNNDGYLDSAFVEVASKLSSNCTSSYNMTPTNQSHSSNAESGTVTINASPECSWTARSNTDWATITFGDHGAGNGTVTYSITANPSHKSREGTLTIAGQTFTITQEGIDCTYSITPTNQSHSSNTETGSVQVRASGDCPWTASSNISWVNIVSGGSGNGDGTVTYAIMENTGATREGTLTIARQSFTITQAGKQSDPPPDAGSVCSTTDDELVFTKLKEFYAVGEIVEVDLVGCATSRFERADLWIAIEMPSGDLLFLTAKPFEPFSLTPQVFRKSVKNTSASYHLLTFELPPDLGGKYTFYAVYVKEGKNPITDSFLVLLSNIAIAETTLSNR